MKLSFNGIREWVQKEANFFRIHLLFFLLVPLVAAGIFCAANGQYPVAFIDALFLCYSALTVTGLSTVNLSTCTVFQQVILYALQGLGDVTIVAWVMVLIRKRYFVQHLEHLESQKRSRRRAVKRLHRLLPWSVGSNAADEQMQIEVKGPTPGHTADDNMHIHAHEGIGAALVGGGITGIGLGVALGAPASNGTGSNPSANNDEAMVQSPKSASFELIDHEDSRPGIVADAQSFTSSPRSGALPLPLSPGDQFAMRTIHASALSPRSLRPRRGVPVPRRQTVIQPPVFLEENGNPLIGQRAKDQGLGGFPGPYQIIVKLSSVYFPRVNRWLTHVLTQPIEHMKNGAYFKKWSEDIPALVILRNSDFDTDELDDEELERLGGLEYQALDFLSYLVFGYFVGVQLVSILLIAPWLSTVHTYDDVFTAQPRLVNKSWFVAFQVMGSYTGGGLSLVDAGMVPFQKAYLMIFSMIFAILAGNHGMPIFLRLIIWTFTKFVEDGSQMDKTLHFLLDHPRRCFLYLFPSHVTWFLGAALVFFTSIEWISFIVLDIGLAVTDSLSPGARAVAGLFQSFAVRASGFSIVSLASVAPAFQFLCIVMMYIAIYPVALSIRSTNVYEERSLGVFELPADEEEEEPDLPEGTASRRERIGKYFGWHLRRQVAYDIWWLVCGIFLICIIERTKIMDDDNAPWFNIFRIVFELVSAFGGIGLTLGIPTQNYSFSGAFGPLSKLVVIVIMLRGRHRGLPVAIDRAILLPEDLVPAKREGDPSVRSPVRENPQSPTSFPAPFAVAQDKWQPGGGTPHSVFAQSSNAQHSQGDPEKGVPLTISTTRQSRSRR
ncbi:hypothetical protein PHLGIDRAFT_32026 [Phlebiopsis gigantea 11061_1 CR5-6]|uniref:Potassium transport protein n=1 Tax=Phlebiopsis gigantea (strain 11061_1 CR5-6) TaxID=745531 RepID=A0A0C3S4C0_PHLG1|nr:hypothetical protein PHLGIDRAFT_32026 [Phlebiopsis gigantea 11061_1 CR5-6]